MYFTRLALLQDDVEQIAEEAWQNFEVEFDSNAAFQ